MEFLVSVPLETNYQAERNNNAGRTQRMDFWIKQNCDRYKIPIIMTIMFLGMGMVAFGTLMEFGLRLDEEGNLTTESALVDLVTGMILLLASFTIFKVLLIEQRKQSTRSSFVTLEFRI